MKLQKMTPNFSAHDFADGGSAYSELACQRPLNALPFPWRPRTSLPNSHHLRRCEFVLGMGLAGQSPGITSSFFPHVVHVRLLCSEPKALGFDAGRIIALMKYLHLLRYRTKIHNPTEDVSPKDWSASSTRLDLAVTKFMLRANPKPAGVRFSDFGPEPFFNRGRTSQGRKIQILVKNCFWKMALAVSTARSRINLHKSVGLICATLSARQGARAFSL